VLNDSLGLHNKHLAEVLPELKLTGPKKKTKKKKKKKKKRLKTIQLFTVEWTDTSEASQEL